jgi:tetratricopeptide (TPR) repeat protein
VQERAAHLLGELQDSVPQAAALFKAGTLLTRTGDDVRSAAVYDKARSIAVRAGCIFVEAEACQALGNVLMRMGDLNQSAAHLKRALDCVESLGDASELTAANQVN